jgi:tetratricopeptide (TPR) repeat protein
LVPHHRPDRLFQPGFLIIEEEFRRLYRLKGPTLKSPKGILKVPQEPLKSVVTARKEANKMGEVKSSYRKWLLLVTTLFLTDGCTTMKSPDRYTVEGMVNMIKGQDDQAISDFTKALEINPRYALAYNSRAVAYYYLQDYNRAWDDVYKAQGLGFGYQIHPGFLKALREASGRER